MKMRTGGEVVRDESIDNQQVMHVTIGLACSALSKGHQSISDMNSSNAIGFVVLGSLMNAVPTLIPSAFAQGFVVAGMNSSALWLHFMGVVVGAIGSSHLLREGFASMRLASRNAVKQVRAQRAAAPAGSAAVGNTSMQTA
ncbi:MAG TPA: hypothetical protein VIM69_11540 [Opitutaceae bacterium]